MTDIITQQVEHENCLQNGHDPALSDDPCSELALVELEVARVSAVLACLMDRAHILKAQINGLYSPFIRMLPQEIISEIFTFCAPIYTLRNKKVDKEANSMPLRLGAVCRAWRRIAWSTPGLWTVIVLHLTSSLKTAAQVLLLQEWLPRSGHLPLSIRLSSSEDASWAGASSEGIIKAIGEYSSRWRDLDVRLPSVFYKYLLPSDDTESYPLLHSLTLKPPGGQGDRLHRINIHTSPQLTHLSLSCLYLRSIKFQWEVLTNLDLESFYIDESLEILGQTTQLVEFTIRRILGGDDRHNLPDEHILLSSLESLSIVNDRGSEVQTLINKITTPKLRVLSYSGESLLPVPSSEFVQLMSRSACALEKLSLAESSIREEPLIVLLRAVPTLTSLSLKMPATSLSTALSPLTDEVLRICDPAHARANQVPCVLPLLESLTYSGIHGFTWSNLDQMVHSRTCASLSHEQPSSSNHIGRTDPAVATGRLREVNLRLVHCRPAQASTVPSINAMIQNWDVKVHVQAVLTPPPPESLTESENAVQVT